jgi:predicted GIY-YIG superfamily endonuclease
MGGVIYALCDPDTNEVRYIGQTKDLKHRLCEHFSARSKLYRDCWIRSLERDPSHFILEECDTREELNEAERFWIDWYRRCGFARLTNLTDGGGGIDGFKHSADARKRISQNHRRGQSATTRSRISASMKRAVTEGKTMGRPRKIAHG